MEDNSNNTKPTEAPVPGQVIDVRMPEKEVSEPIVPIVEAAGDPLADQNLNQDTIPSQPKPLLEPSIETQEEAKAPLGEISQPPPVEHKPGAPLAVIITAIIVALGLAAVTIFAYVKNQDAGRSTNLPSAVQPEQETTSTEVDETSKEVDNTLESADDAADFPESELSDQSLNL